MNAQQGIVAILKKHRNSFHSVIPFNQSIDKLLQLDLTEKNVELTEEILADTQKFSSHINQLLSQADATYGIGGYAGLRKVYAGSKLFNKPLQFETPDELEPRHLHLGIDIWGPAGTLVFAPLGGMVHSFAFNDNDGDYGATIILLHQLEGIPFYTLYGHLRLADLALTAGSYISRGQEFGHFGQPNENGHWPPHLHFQIIRDMELYEGDYPGVCRFSEREKYLSNCPDPLLIIQLTTGI